MMKTSDSSSPQPYYYTDSEFQLELNIQAIRRELIIFLDLETKDCEVCLRMKCRCKEKPLKTPESSKSDNTVSTLTELSVESKDKGKCETKDKLTKVEKSADEDNINIDNENSNAKDAGDEAKVSEEKETPKKDKVTTIASPLQSPPASSLPKPAWDSPSTSSNKETNFKSTAAWVASLTPPKKMDKEKDITTWSVTSVWCEKEVTQKPDVNAPVEDFFKNFSKNFQGKWVVKGSQGSQVNKMIPALKHEMTLAPQNNYNYF